jgi:hypothetical protein
VITRNIFPEQTRTYATYANAVKRANQANGPADESARYLIVATPDGRFFPVFLGQFDLIHQGFAIAS